MHRPLSNLGYNFFSLAETGGFTEAELREIGATGVWIIGTRDPFDSTPYNRKGVTHYTRVNDINRVSESIISNGDEIALELCHVGENMTGCSNISPELISILAKSIDSIMNGKTMLENAMENRALEEEEDVFGDTVAQLSGC